MGRIEKRGEGRNQEGKEIEVMKRYTQEGKAERGIRKRGREKRRRGTVEGRIES